jgi:hypothetical protein
MSSTTRPRPCSQCGVGEGFVACVENRHDNEHREGGCVACADGEYSEGGLGACESYPENSISNAAKSACITFINLPSRCEHYNQETSVICGDVVLWPVQLYGVDPESPGHETLSQR